MGRIKMWGKIILLICTSVISCFANSVSTSSSIRSDAKSVNATVQDEGFLLNETRNGCHCLNYSCGCCEHLEEEKIYLNATVCINATLLRSEYGISVTMTYNGVTLYNETISARNPPPLCVGAPYLKEYAELCVRLYDLDVTRKRFHGCADAEARMKHILLAEYKLGCFDIGHFQSLQSSQENINNSLLVPSVALV
ncbi:uncharacterized protein LOC124165491 [Ischnura elegans]|uniref:uncharacterized protein LOC124165491 n=1 Tax=Ischnura elegans TaxID=197161 RepID=UPI001ED88AFA|nr:uncharacterized protein LOC124165491 [Ischnura elegans]